MTENITLQDIWSIWRTFAFQFTV